MLTYKKPKQSPLDFSLSVSNALITLYCKCGRIQETKSFFEEMPERSILTWTVIISGLAQNGFGEEAMKLFNQMRLEGCEPCDYAFAGAIASCAAL
ncbi:hypothetical protein ACFX16_025863 [Malus domestica]